MNTGHGNPNPTSSMYSSQSHYSSNSNKIGPRGKCDQVVYETIAKAAEIIVRGRCQTDERDKHAKNSNGGVSTGSSISRFHLEVEEVDNVRSILHSWKKSLHIPLRLDIYYEYDTLSIAADGSVTKVTRKDLLERWCIDYLPTFDNNNSTSNSTSQYQQHHTNMHNQQYPNQYQSQSHQQNIHHQHSQQNQQQRTNSVDETILQLRQVVKRVIIFLRVLTSFTRLMPAYKLHHALMTEKSQSSLRPHHRGRRLEGGGPGLTGGYYSQHQQQQHHHQQQQQQPYNNQHHQQQQQQNPTSEQVEQIGGSIKYLFCVSPESSIHGNSASSTSSNHANNNNDRTQQLFSSATNIPFTRHELCTIPTPYGILHLTALYDETLNVKRVLMDRAKRLTEWGTMSRGIGGVGVTRAIPIQRDDQQHQQQQRRLSSSPHSQHSFQNQHHNSNQYSASLNSTEHSHGAHSNNSSNTQQMQMNVQQNMNNNSFTHQHQNQNLQSQSQYQQHSPMSLPNPSSMGSAVNNHMNVVSEHLIQNYARSPEFKGGPEFIGGNRNDNHNTNSQQQQIDIPAYQNHVNNNDTTQHQQVRERLGSDPGYGLIRSKSGKRGMSGLSLALMNGDHQSPETITTNQHEQQHEQQHHHHQNGISSGGGGGGITIPNTLSSSPAPPSNASHEEAASWKQRVALHHPPPSFDSQQHVHYQHNQRRVDTPPLMNTPPQPMFLGSLPSRIGPNVGSHGTGTENGAGAGGIESNTNSPLADEKSPPFRNPVTLQELSYNNDSGSTHGNKSLLHLPQLGSLGMTGGAGVSSTTSQVRNSSTTTATNTENLLLPPLTSLDALASSPFKFPTISSDGVGGGTGAGGNAPSVGHSGSAFSSFTLGKGSSAAFAVPHEDNGFPLILAPGGGYGSGFVSSSFGALGRSGGDLFCRSSNTHIPMKDENDEEDDDNMPFAVEMDEPTMNATTSASNTLNPVGLGSTSGISSSSRAPFGDHMSTSSSQVVTSFAHRCATAGRLKLFDSTTTATGGAYENRNGNNSTEKDSQTTDVGGGGDVGESIASLTNQLAEFKSFGESIMSST